MVHIVGWDIGAANVKAAGVILEQGRGALEHVAARPFEIWREKDRLAGVLEEVSAAAAPDGQVQAMAVTMTAELSDIFATKREGVLFVLDTVEKSFGAPRIYCFSLSGDFVALSEAKNHPLDFAATNWLATAQWIAGRFSDCLIVDVGSTTTDVIPVLNGRVMVHGYTDTERLCSGELVFTGVLRTNLAAIVQSVPFAGRYCPVASEYFAVSGDVHLILGNLKPQDYTCTTPDGREPSVESARSRLARLICADAEVLSKAEIDEIARYIYARQILQIRAGIERVISRLHGLRGIPVMVLGTGAFLGAEAAAGMGLNVLKSADGWQRNTRKVAPSLAVAYLLAEHLKSEP